MTRREYCYSCSESVCNDAPNCAQCGQAICMSCLSVEESDLIQHVRSRYDDDDYDEVYEAAYAKIVCDNCGCAKQLTDRIAELEAQLAAANARIAKLEQHTT